MSKFQKIKIILIGAYPPPIGGNSIHIKRLSEQYLLKGINAIVLDPYNIPTNNDFNNVYRFKGNKLIRGIKLLFKIIKYFDYSIVHIHVSAMNRFFFFAVPFIICTIGRKRLITIHSGSFQERIESKSFFYRLWLNLILNRFNHIITVNDMQANYLIEKIKIKRDKINIIPAFIPPMSLNSNFSIPIELESVKWLVLSSGYCTKLYGYFEILNVIDKLQKEGWSIGIILAIYSEYDKDILRQIGNKIKKMKNAIIYNDLPSDKFISLQKICKLYIRATYKDGDAIAIREAAMMGCRIIASDCVIRPKGCALFKTGDEQSLYLVLKKCLSDLKYGTLNDVDTEYSEKIISLYN